MIEGFKRSHEQRLKEAFALLEAGGEASESEEEEEDAEYY
jgi:hypothetical protein